MTCDVELAFTHRRRTATGPSDYVLVESKSVGSNNDADVTFRALGLRPVPMSKYCIAVALLIPDVRSNPWHRTLGNTSPTRPEG